MKKIMFNDKFDLTQAVLECRKTMTRRFVNKVWVNDDGSIYEHSESLYKIGEVVAVAQSYREIWNTQKRDFRLKIGMESEANEGFIFTKFLENGGWNNKMFVKPSLMPHQIKITDIKVERLQEISDEDCLKEGIRECIEVEDCKRGYSFNVGMWHSSPREAFAELIDKVSGRGTWDSNPYVFAYSFELIK